MQDLTLGGRGLCQGGEGVEKLCFQRDLDIMFITIML